VFFLVLMHMAPNMFVRGFSAVWMNTTFPASAFGSVLLLHAHHQPTATGWVCALFGLSMLSVWNVAMMAMQYASIVLGKAFVPAPKPAKHFAPGVISRTANVLLAFALLLVTLGLLGALLYVTWHQGYGSRGSLS